MGTTTTEMKMFPAAKSQGELEGNLIETREEKPSQHHNETRPVAQGPQEEQISLAHTWVALLLLRISNTKQLKEGKFSCSCGSEEGTREEAVWSVVSTSKPRKRNARACSSI